MASTTISDHLLFQQSVYKPLSPNQTRLLKIHPCNFPVSLLKCDLITATLHEETGAIPLDSTHPLPYEALSYTWGDPAPTEKIQVNDIPFYISKNLYIALKNLRSATKARLLWTDACCINQQDLAEKAQQVEMMFSIYLKASKVVVWLGEASPAASKIFPLIQQVESGLYDFNEAAEDEEARAAAQSFIETTPYFRRTWIRQEVHAASEVQLVCGPYACSFEDFAVVMDDLLAREQDATNLFDPTRDPTEETYRAMMLYIFFKRDCDTYHFPEEEMHNMWFRLIMRSAMYECSMPQDKVYGVLGIVAKMTRSGAEEEYAERIDSTVGFPGVDYTKGVARVYQDFVKHAINGSGNLDALSVFVDRESVGEDLPSWAVDLRRNVPRIVVPLEMFDLSAGEAYGLREQDYQEYGVLRLRGRRLGVIRSTVSPFENGLERRIRGPHEPRLHSCFSTREMWEPEKNGDRGMDEAFQIIQDKCSYNWTTVEPVTTRLYGDADFADFDPTIHQCHALVSKMAKEGDIIVFLCGADVPFVIRRTVDVDEESYSFLGPALLITGTQQRMKKEVFSYSMARTRDMRGEPLEEFILR
ncbi:HET-domain-containing protein [Westerdykella ornata]|uniref:HET-domain-containing protein n=1 Tax=Westerdykella ornata TaxID=318751 RepID=A0A6A6JMP9_WESOR|nr:HET-domain-containing protein [Westerdykella ornata]KAF2277930.1 HET-domain-containing protein [Westerdykella ornata]